MKKLSVFLLAALSIALFSCNKDKNKDENTEQIVRMTTNVSTPDDGSKSGISGNKLMWHIDDKFYTFGMNPNDKITEFSVEKLFNGTAIEGTTADLVAEYNLGTINESDLPYLMHRDLFYLGSYEKGDYGTGGPGNKPSLGLCFGNQTGKFENIGDYHIIRTTTRATFKRVGLREYDFDNTSMTSMSSIVKLDLSQFTGQTLRVNYEIDMNNDGESDNYLINEFKYTHNDAEAGHTYYGSLDELVHVVDATYSYEPNFDVADGFIDLVAQSDETYLVLLPWGKSQENTELQFMVAPFDEYGYGTVVGRVNFPNGIKQNKIYTGPNGDPIRLDAAKAEIEEVAIY